MVCDFFVLEEKKTEKREGCEREKETLQKLISVLKNIRKAGTKHRTVGPCCAWRGIYAIQAASLLASPLAFASSFDELSTNRGWRAFERDGGTYVRGYRNV